MSSGGSNFNYFSENKLTKLTNFVQVIRTPPFPMATPLPLP